ncbi:hypothetical protein ACWEN3_29935, partial [Streptomyces sp. NPDC004561]
TVNQAITPSSVSPVGASCRAIWLPVYVRVSELRKRGAVFVDGEEEVPQSTVRAVSAHGVSPEVRSAAGQQEEVGGVLGEASDGIVVIETEDDGVALFVGVAVEGWWPAAAASLAQSATALVRWDRDDRPDAAFARVFADGA